MERLAWIEDRFLATDGRSGGLVWGGVGMGVPGWAEEASLPSPESGFCAKIWRSETGAGAHDRSDEMNRRFCATQSYKWGWMMGWVFWDVIVGIESTEENCRTRSSVVD